MNTTVVQGAFPSLVEMGGDGKRHVKIVPLTKNSIFTRRDKVSFEFFRVIFQRKAGELWSRVEMLFKEYGSVLSFPVCSALMYAQQDGKLPWCIELLEKHLKDGLSYQQPDLQGRLIIVDNQINQSEMFLVYGIIRYLRPEFFVS